MWFMAHLEDGDSLLRGVAKKWQPWEHHSNHGATKAKGAFPLTWVVAPAFQKVVVGARVRNPLWRPPQCWRNSAYLLEGAISIFWVKTWNSSQLEMSTIYSIKDACGGSYGLSAPSERMELPPRYVEKHFIMAIDATPAPPPALTNI